MKNRVKISNVLLAALLIVFAAAASPATAQNIEPYPSGDEFYDMIKDLAAAHPEVVKLESVGKSVEGRDILALHFGRQDGKTRPAALVTGNIHAAECISGLVAMGAAEVLAEQDGVTDWITEFLDNSDVYIIPLHNPDGYYRAQRTDGKGGEIGYRKNANAVDLNRNFLVAPGAKSRHPMAGNRRPRSMCYMGPEPLSEPETRAIEELVNEQTFYAAVILHSVVGKFLYPYCHTRKPAPHEAYFIRMGEAFVSHQPYKKYKVEQSYSLYPTLGDSDDYLYIYHGVLSVTVEVGTILKNLFDRGLKTMKMYWIANPGDVDYWVQNDSTAVIAALAEAYKITGGVPVEH